jgi:hypothetical protein
VFELSSILKPEEHSPAVPRTRSVSFYITHTGEMGLFSSSGGHTCPAAKNAATAVNVGIPIVGSITFQHLLLYICSGCLGLVGITCLLNIFMHLSHYSAPKQQRQVIRIVFTPVVFCLFSVATVARESTAIYMSPIQDLYETFAMTSIFLLFVEWVAPNPLTRDEYFTNLENYKAKGGRFSKDKSYDTIPGGSFAWFKSKWIFIFLSFIVDIIITIVQEASQAAGTYCNTSMKPYFAHVWVLIIGHAAIIVAVIAILKFYMRLKTIPEFSQHRPLLKLLSLKLIVFTNFVQTFVFSILQGQGVLTGNNKITANDLQYGIPALLVAVEQLIFAALMLYSYRAAEYKSESKQMGFFAAAFNAMNPLDIIQSIVKAFTYLFTSSRNQQNPTFTFQKNSSPQGGNYTSGEDTTLHPYKYSSSEEQNQTYTPHSQVPQTQPHAQPHQPQPQPQNIGVIPNYGGQPGTYPANGATQDRPYYQDNDGGGRSRRGRGRGPIGMLINLGMSAAQSGWSTS